MSLGKNLSLPPHKTHSSSVFDSILFEIKNNDYIILLSSLYYFKSLCLSSLPAYFIFLSISLTLFLFTIPSPNFLSFLSKFLSYLHHFYLLLFFLCSFDSDRYNTNTCVENFYYTSFQSTKTLKDMYQTLLKLI